MDKITDRKLAKVTGYNASVFHQWRFGTKVKKVTPETEFRYKALLLGATLLESGMGFHEALILKETTLEYEAKIQELVDELKVKMGIK